MNDRSQVVTIDGARGTGKSRLAIGLRNYFGCGVLELGPIFRLLAWLVTCGRAEDPKEACGVLDQMLDTGEVQIRLDTGGKLAASLIEIDGQDAEGVLWNSELDDVLRSAAGLPDVILLVAQLARNLVGLHPMIVLGRETGSQFFPDAPVKIILVAEDTLRQERKLSQLMQGPSQAAPNYSLNQSEPTREWKYGEGVIIIDTSFLTPEEVLAQAVEQIRSRLGWLAKMPNERSNGN